MRAVKNTKLDRLQRRVIDADAKMKLAEGTPRFQHRAKVFKQRSRMLVRAELNGDLNQQVNESRNRAEGRRRAS